MAIRISGMVSGLDTDALVKELISSYSTKKDNLVKAQTKQEWKMDAWKEMNTSIYSFYTKKLSNMRLSGTYQAKKANISKSSAATVSASTGAANGTQTLKIKSLAKAGYLTGAKFDTADDSKLTSSTKLSNIKGMESLAGGSKITLNGKDIDITEDMNIGQLVSKMKEAGVNANFDESNKRLFVSAKESGASNDFSLTASDTKGLNVLKSLGLFTVNDKDKAEYTKLAALDGDPDGAMTNYIDKIASSKYYTVDSYTQKLNNDNSTASSKIESLNKTKEDNQKKIEELQTRRADGTLTEEDIAKIDEEIASLTEANSKADEDIATNQGIIDSNNALLADPDALSSKVDELNTQIRADVETDVLNKIAAAKSALAEAATSNESGEGAVRIVGSDSEIWLNGAKYTSNSNSYSINGVNIQAKEVTGDETVTINVDTDVDGIYNNIKEFLKGYNELIKNMDEKYNAASAGKYEPLTDEEKDALTDSEVEKWEKKVKDALLRRDSTLGTVTTAMKNSMMKSFDVNGQKMSLSTFGIKTLGYFSAGDNERGLYHIDGDADDENSSGNADKLREAIANDPESVVNFFQKLSNDLYDTLTNKMKGSTLSSAYTVYNDKQMKTDYNAYKTKISDLEDYLKQKEDYWYKKFSAMESALSKMQSSTQNLTSLFG